MQCISNTNTYIVLTELIKAHSEKKVYTSPCINVFYVEMECGIAAGSATLRPGNSSNADAPGANDWNNSGNVSGGTNDFDF